MRGGKLCVAGAPGGTACAGQAAARGPEPQVVPRRGIGAALWREDCASGWARGSESFGDNGGNPEWCVDRAGSSGARSGRGGAGGGCGGLARMTDGRSQDAVRELRPTGVEFAVFQCEHTTASRPSKMLGNGAAPGRDILRSRTGSLPEKFREGSVLHAHRADSARGKETLQGE